MAVASRINYGGMWACVSVSLPSKNYISSVWGEHMGRRQSDYYTSLPASQLLFLFFGRICYWSQAVTGLTHSSITFWARKDIMFTLIRIKITLTDNKGSRNVPGDMVQSNFIYVHCIASVGWQTCRKDDHLRSSLSFMQWLYAIVAKEKPL